METLAFVATFNIVDAAALPEEPPSFGKGTPSLPLVWANSFKLHDQLRLGVQQPGLSNLVLRLHYGSSGHVLEVDRHDVRWTDPELDSLILHDKEIGLLKQEKKDTDKINITVGKEPDRQKNAASVGKVKEYYFRDAGGKVREDKDTDPRMRAFPRRFSVMASLRDFALAVLSANNSRADDHAVFKSSDTDFYSMINTPNQAWRDLQMVESIMYYGSKK
ncbi:unnamed protein product [Amoebophrya sp. A25]|nr:unnamed protein product [Amoebophrya sp. A25]|eukprot:GSA25T00015822001.1